MKFSLFYVYLNSFPYFAFFVDWFELIFIHSFLLVVLFLLCSSLCSFTVDSTGFFSFCSMVENKGNRSVHLIEVRGQFEMISKTFRNFDLMKNR